MRPPLWQHFRRREIFSSPLMWLLLDFVDGFLSADDYFRCEMWGPTPRGHADYRWCKEIDWLSWKYFSSSLIIDVISLMIISAAEMLRWLFREIFLTFLIFRVLMTFHFLDGWWCGKIIFFRCKFSRATRIFSMPHPPDADVGRSNISSMIDSSFFWYFPRLMWDDYSLRFS